MPTRPSWITDSSLCFRIIESVELMLSGRYDFNRRMKHTMSKLRPLLPPAFPSELQHHVAVLLAADETALVEHPGAPDVLAYGRMTKKKRDQWFAALLAIYNAIIVDRHLMGR